MNLIDFPIICNCCKREIPDGCVYYKHPEFGYVCEYCPEFNDGPIKIEDDLD